MTNAGSVIKLKIGLAPIGDVHAEDYNFCVKFYVYTNRILSIEKRDLIQVDADTFLAVIDTSLLGAGEIFCRIEAEIPDSDLAEGVRREIVTVPTGVKTEA